MNTNSEPGSTPPIDANDEAKLICLQSESVFEDLMEEFNDDYDKVIMTLLNSLGLAFDQDARGSHQIVVAAKKALIKKLVEERLDLYDDER